MNTSFTGRKRLLRAACAALAMTCLLVANVNAFGEPPQPRRLRKPSATYEVAEVQAREVAVSLSACLDIGLANNLDIKIAKIEPLIKGADVKVAKSIFDTVIEGKISYEDDQRAQSSTIAGTESTETNYELGVSTKIPATGTEIEADYSTRRDWTNSIFAVNNPLHTSEVSLTLTQPVLKNFFGYVDRGDVKLSKIEGELADIKSLSKIENVVADIEKAYWQLVFAQEDVSLRKELFEEAKKLYEIFRAHLKTGLAETTETYETEGNMRIRKTELAIAENDLITASNNLKLLLDEGGDYLIIAKDSLKIFGEKITLAESLKNAFDVNRDYKAKKKELKSKKVKLQMKENSLWPEVDLVGTFALNGVERKFRKASGRLTTDKNPMYYGGIEVSVPLENREARGEYDRANLEKEKAILELLQAEKEIVTDIDEKVRNVNVSLENAKRWAKIKEIQRRKFKDEEKKLRYGRSNSKTIIDYQNDFTRANISEYNAILEYYLALIDLENAKDALLAKVGVLG